MQKRICKVCSADCEIIERIFSNGTKHLEAKCPLCFTHNGFLPQPISPEDYVMPYGRHRGLTIAEIARKHPDYAKWVINRGGSGHRLEGLFKAALGVSRG